MRQLQNCRNTTTYVLLLIAILSLFVTGCGEKKHSTTKERALLSLTAMRINDDFSKINQEVAGLADVIGELYQPEVIEMNRPNFNIDNYQLADNGVYYKPQNDGGSAVFVSGAIEVDEAVKEIVYFTEFMDSKLIELTKTYPEVVQAYYNDKNSYNRIYPYFDVLAQYGAKMVIPDFNFYYLADEKHNPAKKSVWVNEPYVDPAGRGWMVSAIAPVYVNDILVGVPGLDVTISTITDRYLTKDDYDIVILDENGTVVAINDYLTGVFSLPPLKDHKYLETIRADTYKSDNYNLLKSRSEAVRNLATAIYSDIDHDLT
ncbi:MAG: hypothetical protein B6226_05035 [Candidatus Cloacimonetes bacterium 4572_65]|nr:MAG: hypothetical protein B6226_05035 [Candidatus Cloacimonetes bacterium 4572_65]